MKKRNIYVIGVITAFVMGVMACGTEHTLEQKEPVTMESAVTSKAGLIPVELKNLPKEIKESDLIKEGDDYYIDSDALLDIAKKTKKDIVIESLDGYRYTASETGGELAKTPVKKDTKEQEKTKKDNGPSSGTNAGGTTSPAGSSNTSGGTSAGGEVSTGSASSGAGTGGSAGGNHGGNTAPVQQPAETPTQPAHTHSYTIYQGGTPATCTSVGTEIYACSCGATITNTTPMSPHSFAPVYRTEDQGWNEDIVEYHTVCNGCGAYADSFASFDDFIDHVADCGPGSYRGTNIVVGQQWHSNPVDVLDHYECSVCGKKQ